MTQEVQAVLPISEGRLPSDLRGVLFRNGPGRFANHGQTYGHLIDGDGMVIRFAIGSHGPDGQPCIRYRNSYVRTTEFVYEQRSGRLLYRNFGTNRAGGFFGNLFRTHVKTSPTPASSTTTAGCLRCGRRLAAPAGPGEPRHD